MIDINLLRLMRLKTDFNAIMQTVRLDTLDKKTQLIAKALRRYYKQHINHKQLNFQVFLPMFESIYTHLTEDDKKTYRHVFANMNKNYPDEATRKNILASIQEYNFVYEIFNLAEQYQNGEDIAIIDAVKELLVKTHTKDSTDYKSYKDEDLDTYLEDVWATEKGLTWFLPCLNDATRPLVAGDSIIVAARPDQGKTSFVGSQAVHMARQLPKDAKILWFNNEGDGKKIRLRLMQAALIKTQSEVFEMQKQGTLYDAYQEAVNGKNKIQVLDVRGKTIHQLETIIQDVKPSVIIFDMLDNVLGFNDQARGDLRLELLYQRARDLGAEYNAITFATSQISHEGQNEMYPTQSMLMGSKTAKQGACDAILMIGSVEEKIEYANTRWVSLPKNKIKKEGAYTLMEQVCVQKDLGRYKEIGANRDE